MKFVVPIILITISVLSFLFFTNPTYKEIKDMKVTLDSYNSALNNAQELQKDRDELSAKYSTLSASDLKRLSQLLPDSADNIRLIIDLQRMAQAYGMTISSTKFDAKSKKAASETNPNALIAASATDVTQASKDYGIFDLEFATVAPYENFLKFIKDVESSLRLSDIQSIEFSADSPVGTKTPVGISPGNTGPNGYSYTIKLRTYWLKG